MSQTGLGEWLTLELQPEAVLMKVTLEQADPVAFTLTLKEALDLGEAIVKLVRGIPRGSQIGEPVG